MADKAFEDHFNEVADSCCTLTGTNPDKPYCKGLRKGQPRDVYELNNNVYKLWDLGEPYVIASVVRSVGYKDEDLISEIKMQMMVVLRDFGSRLRTRKNPEGQSFFVTFKSIINNVLTNRVQMMKTTPYVLSSVSGSKYVTKGRDCDRFDKVVGVGQDDSKDEVVYAREAHDGLDRPMKGFEGVVTLGDTLGADDEQMKMVDFYESVAVKDRPIIEAVVQAGSISEAQLFLAKRHIKETVSHIREVALKYVPGV